MRTGAIQKRHESIKSGRTTRACLAREYLTAKSSVGVGELILKHAAKLGFEGIVSKTINAPYVPTVT